MSIKTRKITGKQLRDFVRGEISYLELKGELKNPKEVTLTGGDGYKITLEDLAAGIRNNLAELKKGNLSENVFFNQWVYALLYQVGDLICLPEFLGKPGGLVDEIDLGGSMFMDPFFKNETELANYVFSTLYDFEDDKWVLEDDQMQLEEELQDLLNVISNYPENKGKKKAEWVLTEKQIRQFVYNNDDDDLKDEDEETIALWKKYLEELVEKEDAKAVKILGYACYGDDHCVYKCDWVRSRDCMLKLMEIANDEWKAMAANTLGYIYYYGRTNEGVPEYEEAYKYFSLAAFFGYYEAIYKVGDMIMAGKGIPKNEKAAFRMYRFVYNDCYPSFLEDGIGHQFADAALRMGGAYHKGKGTWKDLMRAYGYYLQARLAIDNRMKRSHFFGDTAVSAGIRNSISEIRKELGDKCRQKKYDIDFEEYMQASVFPGVNEVKISVARKKTEISITFKRCNLIEWYPEPNILTTIPEMSYCRLSPEITITAPASTYVEVMGTGKSFKAHNVILEKNEFHFFYRNKLVMVVDGDGWYIKAPHEKGAGKMHQFVGICFEGSERVYDYLCDGMDIKPGDDVIVPSYNGPQKVKAVRVFEQSEADAPLDITKYKKVLS